MTLGQQIKQEARQFGFQAVGISLVHQARPSTIGASATDLDDSDQPSLGLESSNSSDSPLPHLLHPRLVEWLRRGYHGTMAWMARDPTRRADPTEVLAGCRSVISLGVNYYTDHVADERPGRGRIARYAWGQDYHDVLLSRVRQLEARIKELAPEATTKGYVDTGPVMEKAWAQQGGLGWIGKHTNLVSPQFGSWLLLAEILTTLALPADEPGSDLCGSCSLCIQACPTGAITEPYVVDARRCISYLTIELRGDTPVATDLAALTGNRIFGCDDCLDACPYNAYAQPTEDPAFQPSPLTLGPELAHLATLSEAEFGAAFRRSPVRRPKFSGFMRNVRLALDHLRRLRPVPQAKPRITT